MYHQLVESKPELESREFIQDLSSLTGLCFCDSELQNFNVVMQLDHLQLLKNKHFVQVAEESLIRLKNNTETCFMMM